MGTIKQAFGTASAVTITLGTLASDTSLLAGRQSAAVDFSAAPAIDYLVGGKITTGTSPTASRVVEVWAAGCYDGTTFASGAGTGDAAFTPTGEKTQMRLLNVIDTDSTGTHIYEFGPVSVASAFGGMLPAKAAFYVVHNTGVALNSVGTNHELKVTPVYYETA